MALPESIKGIFRKIGSKYSIVLEGGLDEDDDWYCEPILNTQATKPFVLLNFLKVNFPFDTEVVPGSVIEFDIGDNQYLVTVMLPEHFKNRVNQYMGVLYRCNDVATIKRKSETRTVNNKLSITWSAVGRTWPCLVADPYLGSEISENTNDEMRGMFNDGKQNLYVSSASNILLADRISLAETGGNHMVTKIKRTRYDNVLEIELDDDTRQ